MIDEMTELNIERCVDSTNEVKMVLEDSRENLYKVFGVTSELLASVKSAIRDHEYYHPVPDGSEAAYKLLKEQILLMEYCQKIAKVSEEFDALCKGYAKLTNDLKARYTAA